MGWVLGGVALCFHWRVAKIRSCSGLFIVFLTGVVDYWGVGGGGWGSWGGSCGLKPFCRVWALDNHVVSVGRGAGGGRVLF